MENSKKADENRLENIAIAIVYGSIFHYTKPTDILHFVCTVFRLAVMETLS